MTYTVAQYLQLYAELSNQSASKTANRHLLLLQESVEVWSIAGELIRSANAAHNLHGCHLLSKKLNSSLPTGVNAEDLMLLLLENKMEKSAFWLCFAKLIMHSNLHRGIEEYKLDVKERILLLSQIPFACTQVKLRMDSKTVRKSYFQRYKGFLCEQFPVYPGIVMACLENYVSNEVRINSSGLLLAILNYPLEDTCGLLEQIFAREQYPELNGEVMDYLNRHIEDEAVLPVYLVFCKSLQLLSLPLESLQRILSLVLEEMRTSAFIDTYEFWQQVKKQLGLTGRNNHTNRELLLSCLDETFKIVCEKSFLVELPSTIRAQPLDLSIDVDEDQDLDLDSRAVQSDQQNHLPLKVRDYALDFIVLVVEALRLQGQGGSRHRALFGLLHTWATGSLLQMQFVLYALESLCDYVTEEEKKYCSQIMRRVFEQETRMNEYLCQKVVILLGRMRIDLQILPLVLAFMAKSLQFEQLAPLASESFCDLVESLEGDSIESFIQNMYSSLYANIKQPKVLENITRALVIYIYKFKQSPQSYLTFLLALKETIIATNKRLSVAKYLQSIITAQIWLNTQPQSAPYLAVFAQFITQFTQYFQQLVANARKKSDLADALLIIGMAIKTQAGSLMVKEWCELVHAVLGITSQATAILTTLVKTVNSAASACMVVILLREWEPKLTSKLMASTKQDSSLESGIMQLHVSVVSLFTRFKEQTYEYEANPMVMYLLRAINERTHWDYELYRHAFMYFSLLISLGYCCSAILDCLFANYKRVEELMWKSLESILFAAYKQQGMPAFMAPLAKVKPELLPPNVLWGALERAFQTGQGKHVKNIFLCL